MALLKYLRKKATVLPNPDGPLSDRMPSVAISSANNEMKDLVNATPSDSRKRGPYHNYTDEDRALIGKRAAEFGVTNTVRHFGKQSIISGARHKGCPRKLFPRIVFFSLFTNFVALEKKAPYGIL